MKKKKGLTKKEKIEMGIILGSVLFVAVVGLILNQIGQQGTFAGMAYFDESNPTTEGTLLLLQEYSLVTGEGDCRSLCGGVCWPEKESCLDGCKCYEVG